MTCFIQLIEYNIYVDRSIATDKIQIDFVLQSTMNGL